MAMTDWEKRAKAELQTILRKQGYPTYADLFDKYHFNVTRDPGVLGYMEPATGTIVINADLDIDQASVTIRHEILHYYLQHVKRMYNKVAREMGLDPKAVDDSSIEDINRVVFSTITNIAGDYEISNLAYTDKDKAIIRGMNALVTEDDHEDWANLTMEEMFDKLREEAASKPKIVYGALLDSTTFIGADRKVYGA